MSHSHKDTLAPRKNQQRHTVPQACQPQRQTRAHKHVIVSPPRRTCNLVLRSRSA